ncbi:MAG: DUF4019 domain-containing protein, partial [Pseudomonadota bacterium]
ASSPSGLDLLSEKERAVLRLITRGHDAKSAANELGLSVHTVNERLRAARRKLDVTSSREAARRLFSSESAANEKSVSKQMGDAGSDAPLHALPSVHPSRGAAVKIGGVVLMSMMVLALALSIHSTPGHPDASQGDAAKRDLVAFLKPVDKAPEEAARAWLTLVDKADWQASFNAAGASFRNPNTVEDWQAASQQARVPLGAVVEREIISTDFVAAPPKGFTLVKFLTKFEGDVMGVEHVTLEREGNDLRVIGYFIE